MRRTLLAGLLLVLLPFAASAQQRLGTVLGRVTDETGQPLVGVQLVIQGTGIGALSGTGGRYAIQRVPAGPQVVKATFVGYATMTQAVTVPASGNVTADLQLRVEAIALQGIVAVGYGTQKKASMTAAVGTVKLDEIAQVKVPTLTQSLIAASPGLQILDGGALPGRNAMDILVRGQGTLGNNASGDAGRSRPLVLIDGISGTMDNVDVNDIESVSVLKDAASAAIYGARAANGVILITTKRGAAREKVQVSYSGYWGMQNITTFPERVSTADHMRLTNLAYTNAGRAPKYSDDYIQKTLSGTDPLHYPSTDWVGMFFQPAPIQDHTMRVTGGNQSARFALSANYMKENGMEPTTGSDRYAVRLNTDFKPWSRVTAGVDLNASRRWNVAPYLNWESTFYLIHDVPPTVVAQYPNGQWGWSDTGRNPLAYANDSGTSEQTYHQGVGTGRFNVDLLPGWLQLQTQGSVLWYQDYFDGFRTAMRYMDYFDPTRQRQTWGPTRAERTSNTGQEKTLRAMLDFKHDFFDAAHNVSALFGYEQIQRDDETMYERRDNAYSNDLRIISMGDEATDVATGSGSGWRMRSVFGRFNYSYKGRYLLEGNARYDGSSRFRQGRQYGLFPSASVGWRLTEEPWFKVPGVSDFKLRGSWGELGNSEVALYSYYNTISLSPTYYFNDATNRGAAKTSLANQDISWETTTTKDAGFDAGFLGNRLTATADVYDRLTKDILLNLPIPALIGMSAPPQNKGTVRNRGWEVALGWKDKVRDVNYGVDFSLSDNRNKVIDLAGTGPYVSGESVVMVGAPVRAWYGYQAVGLFQSQAEVNSWPTMPGPARHAGDIKWKDQNGDGKIDASDRVVMGDPNPHYQFGLNLTASWKRFDATSFFQGVGARDQYIALGFAEGPVWENYISKWHLNYWTPQNPNARMPAYYLYQNYNQGTPNSWWILKAKYVKLRNLQLGYSLPPALAGRIGAERMRLYVAGKNLFTYAPDMDIAVDPEFPWVRADYYPQTKVFSIGADVSF